MDKHKYCLLTLLAGWLSIVILFLPACGTLKIDVVPEEQDAPTATRIPSNPELPSPTEMAVATMTPYIDHWTDTVFPAFRVELEHPADWLAIEGYGDTDLGDLRLGGVNGFVQVGAMNAPDLDAAVEAQAGHHLQPYGSQPTIEPIEVHDQAGRLITPSSDQVTDFSRQAAVIVRYPQPVEINEQPYNFLILWADEAHIRAIAQTTQFVGSPSLDEPSISSVTITGTVMNVSLSARIITLEEPVDGYSTIALTGESVLLSIDGNDIELRDIQHGITIKVFGQPGDSGALIANQVLAGDETPIPAEE